MSTSPYSLEDTHLKDSHLRSILKGLTWRVLATLTTVIIAYLIIGEVKLALHIGGIEFIAKFMIYYLHERAWASIPLGTIRKVLPH